MGCIVKEKLQRGILTRARMREWKFEEINERGERNGEVTTWEENKKIVYRKRDIELGVVEMSKSWIIVDDYIDIDDGEMERKIKKDGRWEIIMESN